jgi:hypothetical protein
MTQNSYSTKPVLLAPKLVGMGEPDRLTYVVLAVLAVSAVVMVAYLVGTPSWHAEWPELPNFAKKPSR